MEKDGYIRVDQLIFQNHVLQINKYVYTADTIMKNGFLLGAHHGMTIDDVDRVCNLLKNFAKGK